MGSHKIWDLGSGGPKMEIWGTGMDGALWDLRFGVGWMKAKVDLWDRDGRIWGSGMNGLLWDLGFGVEWTKGGVMGPG